MHLDTALFTAFVILSISLADISRCVDIYIGGSNFGGFAILNASLNNFIASLDKGVGFLKYSSNLLTSS